MKNKFLMCFLLFALTPNAQSEVAQAQIRPLPRGVELVDIVLYRPFGLATTIVGTAVFVGISPLTGLAAISPPHDAFEKAADLLIMSPARFTFDRPMGVYYADPDGRYRRHR
jgi:hypothetical protein